MKPGLLDYWITGLLDSWMDGKDLKMGGWEDLKILAVKFSTVLLSSRSEDGRIGGLKEQTGNPPSPWPSPPAAARRCGGQAGGGMLRFVEFDALD